MPFPGGIGGLVGGLGSLLGGGGHSAGPPMSGQLGPGGAGPGQLGTARGAMQGLGSSPPPMHPALSSAQFGSLLEI